MSDRFDLIVHISADDWAYCSRRLEYLETVLFRLIRDHHRMQEWFSAAEIAALRLPGLPDTAAGLTRRATSGEWPRKLSDDRRRFVYHVSCLPPRAFDALLSRILGVPEMESLPEAIQAPPAPIAPELPANATPAWVLPLMRLMKTEAAGDLGRAWAELPKHVPASVRLPGVKEAAETLVRLGLA